MLWNAVQQNMIWHTCTVVTRASLSSEFILTEWWVFRVIDRVMMAPHWKYVISFCHWWFGDFVERLNQEHQVKKMNLVNAINVKQQWIMLLDDAATWSVERWITIGIMTGIIMASFTLYNSYCSQYKTDGWSTVQYAIPYFNGLDFTTPCHVMSRHSMPYRVESCHVRPG